MAQPINQLGTRIIDLDAFEQLIREHAPAIVAFTGRYFRDPQDAQDAAQEAFVRAWERRTQWDPSLGTFRNWLFRIAANSSINELRRQSRARDREERLAAERPRDSGTDPAPPAGHLEGKVSDALHALPDEERRALLLVYYHEMTYREVGDLLGTPVGTIKSRVHTAIGRLQSALVSEEEGASR